MQVYGNNAYKLETEYEAYESKRNQRKKIAQQNRKKAVKRNAALFLTVTFLAFGLVFRYAQIIEQTSRITEMKKQIAATQSKIIANQCAIEKKIDLDKIEQLAVSELGMQRPQKSQTVYINMEAEDYTEGTETESRNVFAAFINSLKFFD